MRVISKHIITAFLIAGVALAGSYLINLRMQWVEDNIYRYIFPLSNLYSDDIVLILIGNSFDRADYAKIISYVMKGNPKVIGIDVFFDGIKNIDKDIKLAKVFANANTNIVLAIYPMEFDNLFINLININESSLSLHNYSDYNNITYGNIQIFGIEGGGIIRFIPARFIERRNNREYLPFPIMVVNKYIDNTQYGQKLLHNGSLIQTLGNIEIPLFKRNNDILPERIMINYLYGIDNFKNIPFEKVTQVNPAIFKGKIVLLGNNGQFVEDTFHTPISNNTPGILIHANAIDTILNNRFIYQISIGYQLLYSIIIAFIISISIIFIPPRDVMGLGILLSVIILAIFRIFLFYYHLYLYILLPQIAMLLSYVLTIMIKPILLRGDKSTII